MVEVVKGGLPSTSGSSFLAGLAGGPPAGEEPGLHGGPDDPGEVHQAQSPAAATWCSPVARSSRRSARRKEHTLECCRRAWCSHGTVKNITDYGAFIDLGGIDGLLHVTDMSWVGSAILGDLPGRRSGGGGRAPLRPRDGPRLARLQAEVVGPVGARREDVRRRTRRTARS